MDGLPFKVPYSLEEALAPIANPLDDDTLPARVKEVFVIFDQADIKSDGFLSMTQIWKLLKKLGGFEDDEIAGFCSDIDKSGDGKVSYPELLHWVQKRGGASGEQVARAIIRETNKRAMRIKAVFDKQCQKHDHDGSGSLDLLELRNVLRELGAFTSQEIGNVIADLDANRDGDISFLEFADWVRRGTDLKEVIKAKCILAPSDSNGIEAVFYNYCGTGHLDLDGKSFSKLIRDCKLLNKSFTLTNIDLIFSDKRVKAKKQRRIDFFQFEVALELVAEKRGSSLEEVRNAMLQVTAPVLKGTKATRSRFSDELDEADSTLPRKEGPEKRKRKRLPGLLLPLDAPVGPVDNVNLWKTFGAETPAGRCLRRLYMQKNLPTLESVPRFKVSWPESKSTYMAVNAKGDITQGVQFRRSTNLADTCADPNAVVTWGSSVKGETVGDDWLRVGIRFLPISLEGAQVMQKCTSSGELRTPQRRILNSSLSLSDLWL